MTFQGRKDLQPVEALAARRTFEGAFLAMTAGMTSQVLNPTKDTLTLRTLERRVFSPSSLPITGRTARLVIGRTFNIFLVEFIFLGHIRAPAARCSNKLHKTANVKRAPQQRW